MKNKLTISIAETVKATLAVVAMCAILYSVNTDCQLEAKNPAAAAQSTQFLTLNK